VKCCIAETAMPRLNFDIDEATLLKTYRINSLNPMYAFPQVEELNLFVNSHTLVGDGKTSTMILRTQLLEQS